jgi:hypothetical protein
MDSEAGLTAGWGVLGMFSVGMFDHLNILKNIDL